MLYNILNATALSYSSCYQFRSTKRRMKLNISDTDIKLALKNIFAHTTTKKDTSL